LLNLILELLISFLSIIFCHTELKPNQLNFQEISSENLLLFFILGFFWVVGFRFIRNFDVFSPILILLFNPSRIFEGVRKFVSENSSFIFVYGLFLFLFCSLFSLFSFLFSLFSFLFSLFSFLFSLFLYSFPNNLTKSNNPNKLQSHHIIVKEHLPYSLQLKLIPKILVFFLNFSTEIIWTN
jgi:hypothetical protein